MLTQVGIYFLKAVKLLFFLEYYDLLLIYLTDYFNRYF